LFQLIFHFPVGFEIEIVNSCDSDNGGCSHHCRHGTLGPVCSCNQGYQLAEDLKTCLGECAGVQTDT